MSSDETPRGILRFTLFNIPTQIHPSSWLVLLVLGSSGSRMGDISLQEVLLFVVAGMLCLLVHEYGHALVGRSVGGRAPVIEIASLGGVTRFSSGPPGRGGALMMVLAGSAASLLLAAAAGVIMGACIGSVRDGLCLALLLPLPGTETLVTDGLIRLYEMSNGVLSGPAGLMFIRGFLELTYVCVFWSLLNLLPILPLDGGSALLLATQRPRLTVAVSMVTAVLLLTLCAVNMMFFGVLICAWLVLHNYQMAKSIRLSNRERR